MALQDPLSDLASLRSPCVHAIIYTRIVYFNECFFFLSSLLYLIVFFVVPRAGDFRGEPRASSRRDARRHTPTSTTVLSGTIPLFRVLKFFSSSSPSAPGKHVCFEIGLQNHRNNARPLKV